MTNAHDQPQEQEVQIFMQWCPPVELVSRSLARAHCFRISSLPAGRGIPSQHHYEGAYGLTVVFLAGFDATYEHANHLPEPPDHAARFWVNGPGHQRTQEIRQHVTEILTDLAHQHTDAQIQKRSA